MAELRHTSTFKRYCELVVITSWKYQNMPEVFHFGPSTGPKSWIILPLYLRWCISTPMEERLVSRSCHALLAAARAVVMSAFCKINFGLLEPSLAADAVRNLEMAIRTHPRAGSTAVASLVQALLDRLFPGARLPPIFASARPGSFSLLISKSIKLEFTAFEVALLGGRLLASDVLSGHGNKIKLTNYSY